MKLPNEDDPIRIYLKDNPPTTQLQWKEDFGISPKQYGMRLKKRHKKK